jgi:hypothetical protein
MFEDQFSYTASRTSSAQSAILARIAPDFHK